jgi:gliding motility-associated protein GldE
LEDPDPEPYLATLNILAEQFFVGFPTEAIIALAVLLVLIVFSGLVSGSETAFFSLTPSDLEGLRTSMHKKDSLVLEIRSRPKALLATILISNNFINVAIVILAAYISSLMFNLKAFPVLAFLLQVVIITSVILLFGEIIPKILANREPVTMANLMVRPLLFLVWLFKPLSFLLVRSTSLIDKRLVSKGHNISVSELSDAIEITVDETVPADEKMILKGIASFVEREASEIMQSRVNVTAIDSEIPFRDMMKVVMESGYSRIPVYEETLDKITGILYIKDLLPFLHEEDKPDWIKLLRPAFFVPENKRINDLLQEFREKKIHLAIVVDEYGGTSGIITLEDIIEEIVGEISDEFDKEDYQFRHKRISSKSYLFEAKTPLSDLCKIVGISEGVFDEVRGESDSIGGLILELEGKIPEKGEVIKYRNFKFTIMDATSRMIKEVKIMITKEDTANEE